MTRYAVFVGVQCVCVYVCSYVHCSLLLCMFSWLSLRMVHVSCVIVVYNFGVCCVHVCMICVTHFFYVISIQLRCHVSCVCCGCRVSVWL